MRNFEMPPHARMSLVQQLLMRALVARFWNRPYVPERLVRWGTTLHDRFMLPHFVWEDLRDVVDELRADGYPLELAWFAPHLAFRFPHLGDFAAAGVEVELRMALEPWNVLGEEGFAGGTARYVDSSLERIEVKAAGLVGERHVLTCNGRRLPLQPTGVAGEFVAGIRYRAWNPPNALHPTIGVQAPLVLDLVDTWIGPLGRRLPVPRLASGRHQLHDLPGQRPRGRGAPPGALLPQRPHAGSDDGAAGSAQSDFPHTLDLRRPVQ
jgi:uncharacterized protein (DUF2126 family)